MVLLIIIYEKNLKLNKEGKNNGDWSGTSNQAEKAGIS